LNDVPTHRLTAIDEPDGIVLSVIVPVKNEQDNILPLIGEIRAALADGPAYEIVYVDDGSNDGTQARLAEAGAMAADLRVVTHAASCGQSAALRTGVIAARGQVIATLDGDGQNDPADVPRLVRAFLNPASASELGMIAGQRVKRHDNTIKH
jgi:dolichol-phosphate mannosyltransferase